MDRASVIGIMLGVAAVVGGNISEGGRIGSILQPTAALIVFCGTAGATLVSFPFRDVMGAVGALGRVFSEKEKEPEEHIREILRLSGIARRKGIVALDREIPKIEDGFLKKGISLSVDRLSARAIRETLDQENDTYEAGQKRIARVYETAGGYAPTIGILGAVLGLIHVMENLSEPSKLGAGIAVAFVATIYGVGSANLLLIPIAKKLHNRLHEEMAVREMIIEGVIGIQSGLNPHYLRERLTVFFEEDAKETSHSRTRASGKH